MAACRAVMIADTVKKDVVYSAQCFDQKPLDSNTQLVVEYSIIALEAKTEAGDTHDTIRYIDGAIDVVKGCLAVGSFAFPPAAPVLQGIAAVGSAIQFFMGLFPDDRPDPVLEKYKELKRAIHELETKITDQFADMQSFMTEHNFNVNITTQAATLMRYLKNCLQHQEKEDVANFAEEYKKNYPLSAVYFMSSFLENDSTNPLIMAMNAEKAKTKATFNKWKTIISGILGEFLFIEAFASGLLGKSDFNRNQIVKLWEDLDKTFDEWEDKYENDSGYWEELKDGFEKYFEEHTNLNNAQKAEELRDRLSKQWTNDAFYICVFNDKKSYRYHYSCLNEQDQFIGSWGKGRCNAFVYRSRKANQLTKEDYENMRERYETWFQKLRRNTFPKDTVQEFFVGFGMKKFGLTCLLEADRCEPQICFVNKMEPGRDWGPGHFRNVKLTNWVEQEYSFLLAFR